MFRTACFFLLSLLVHSSVYARGGDGTALVKGRLVYKATLKPAPQINIIFPSLNSLNVTDGNGDFHFSQVPFATYIMVISAPNVQPDTVTVVVDKDVVDLGVVYFQPLEASNAISANDIPTIALDEANTGNSNDDESNDMQNISGLFTASRDPFLNTAAFVFGPYWFSARGYERNQQQIQINGIQMNDLESDNSYWNQWGGLNDVFRSSTNTYGLAPSEYGYGAVNGLVYYDITAANQRKQTRLTYSSSNRTYRNKLAITHSSGVMKNGWAYSLSFSKRWAQEGYVEGTFFDGYSYYAGISKQVKNKHFWNLTAFGAPTERGKASFATAEAYELAGTHFYNSNWGYQNGEKRNARVANTNQPQFILNYEYHPTNRTRWNTSVGYQLGKNKSSTIDWYNGRDPRPDYYKNLPSYYTIPHLANPTAVAAMKAEFEAHPEKLQVDWDRFYESNRMNIEQMPGRTDSGARSIYVVGNDVDDIKKWVFNTNIEHSFNDRLVVYGGLTYINQRTESYRELADLLGGDYFLNNNQFAERQFVGSDTYGQNDLEDPDKMVKEGDKYYYHYINQFNKATGWAQATLTLNKVDIFLTASGGVNSFYREGKFRNGVFPNNSFGKSATQTFILFGTKGGITYKLDGRNLLFMNAGYTEDAPLIERTYISIRSRDFTVNDPTTVKTKSIEGGYLMRAPGLNLRAVGYATDVQDAVEIRRFYSDDYQNFTSMVIAGMNLRFIGTELAASVKLSPSFTASAVAALGQAFYTNRPRVSLYRDNDTAAIEIKKTAYIQNYYIGNGPQSAYNLGLSYHSKHYWSATVNFSYFDRNYVDINPERRSPEAVDLVEPGSQQWKDILEQEKLPAFYTVNLFITKSVLLSKISRSLPDETYLYISLGVNNLLNNKNIVTGGYEWLRFNNSYKDVNMFGNKYYYGFGTNYFLNLGLKF